MSRCDACGHGGRHHLWDMCDVEDVPFADRLTVRAFCGCPGYEPSESLDVDDEGNRL